RSLALAARMRVRAEVRLAPVAVRDVRVSLRRADVRVPEHLLDAPEIGSALEEVGGKRMPQQVRVDASGLEPGAIGQAPQDEERPRARQRPAARVEEQVGAVATVEVRAPERHVATE